jgi:hypothetical protein
VQTTIMGEFSYLISISLVTYSVFLRRNRCWRLRVYWRGYTNECFWSKWDYHTLSHLQVRRNNSRSLHWWICTRDRWRTYRNKDYYILWPSECLLYSNRNRRYSCSNTVFSRCW